MLEPLNIEKTVDEALEIFLKESSAYEPEAEIINVEESLSRILYEDIYVKSDQPASDKALIDGYAVSAFDIAQADSHHPITLNLIGEAETGTLSYFEIKKGETVKISKGALMPKNADAVIMPEDTLTKGNVVKAFANVISGFQVAKKGDDLREGEAFILKQRKIRPQDIGGIIGAGYRQIKVFKKPVVTIIPTGSELVPIDIEPEPTQIIASNSYMIKGFVEQLGGVGKITGIVNDDLKLVQKAIIKALEVSDMIIVSGGSAFGAKDYTLKAIEGIEGSKIIAHSVAMKPGGHVLLAVINGKPVIGLPGHPVSSMTCFNVFAKPVLRKLCGDPRSFWQIMKDTPSLKAILTKKVVSPKGKDDFVRVRLKELGDGRISAYPFTGRSSFLSTLVRSHGIIQLPADCTALYEGDVVEVYLF